MTIRVTDDTPLSDLEECLAHLCHAAKRQIPKVGDEEHPTGWDKAHLTIDAVLDDWVRARTREVTA